MKEAKVVTIVSTILLIILMPLGAYYYFASEFIYNILISIITGIVVTIITSLCQYFVMKEKIKNNIFNCYFDMYKAIYVSKHKKVLFHYPVLNIYKRLLVFSDELSKNLSEYSSFYPTTRNKLYKKLNPTLNPNFDKFNIKNLSKLILPLNSKRFKELIIPMQETLEKILREINVKKFEKELMEYKKIYKVLNK